MAMRSISARDVELAMGRLLNVALRTPLERSARLSETTGGNVWLKREDQQRTRSYKLRGAYNFLVDRQFEAKTRGVVCASAGNHAQGVAWSCRALGIEATVFLPHSTSRQKRERISSIGGPYVRIELAGQVFDEALAAAQHFCAAEESVFVPAFDDPAIVAGQGTVGLEIVEQLGTAPQRVVCPVGGGGLIAGIVCWLSERHPGASVIGVEPTGAASMAAALRAGHPITLDSIDRFVDGAAVRRAGDLPFEVVRAHGIEILDVSEGRVCTEMLTLYQQDGIIAEPAGALASACLSSLCLPGETTVCILSGGNNDVSRYSEIIERSLIDQGRKYYFLVEFAQEPGALRHFLDESLGPDDDITLFEYVKRNNRETGPALVGIEIADVDHLQPLLGRMDRGRIAYRRIGPNDPMFQFLVL